MAETLRIIKVDVDNVGQPRHDGSRGSALYAVPIKLSRRPTSREARLLVAHWDRPASWTTMHRPGIARLEGDLLILDGTTIDEVERYHAQTAQLAVNATNRDEARAEDEDRARQRQEAEDADAHRRHVREAAERIKFDVDGSQR